MATTVPETNKSHLSSEDIRAFLLDNQVENNLLDLDLTWSEDEIASAKRRCALMWSGLAPVASGLDVNPHYLPNAYVFLIGTAYQLYLSTLQKYQRNDLDYTVGGVKTNLFSKRIEHFERNLKMLREEFNELGKSLKIKANMDNSWGAIG
jgi:hypothetical protein